jgi:DegV family protein with EDD domain
MIRIISDTLAGIPSAITKELEIIVMPQFIIIDGVAYRDDTELPTEKLFKKMRSPSADLKTAAPQPALYIEAFQKILGAGDSALVIAPSSQVSGTMASASVAKQEFPADAGIEIFDTQVLSGPQANMSILAAEWARLGIGLSTIIDRLTDLRKRMHVYFIVDTLEYLYRGGRIGGAKALIGSILQVKPILTPRNGIITTYGLVRSRRKAIQRIIELTLEKCPKAADSYITVLQCCAEDDATELKNTLSEILNINEIPIFAVSPSVAVHGGPGILAVSFFEDNHKE